MLNEILETGLRERFLILRAMPFANALDDPALMLLAEHARNRRVARGEVLLEAGRPVESMFVVLEGQVTATAYGRHLNSARKNQSVGVAALLAKDPEGNHAVADEDSEVIEIPGEALLAAYREDFSLIRNVLRMQSRGILRLRDGLPRHVEGSTAELGTPREGLLTLVERVMRIRRSRAFEKANLDALFELARHATELRFAAGERIWTHGEPATYWIQIEYGLARCENPEGRASVVGCDFVLGPLDCWAELGRSFSATAETDMIVHRVFLEPMLGVLETHYDVAMDLVAAVSRVRLSVLLGDG